MSDRTILRRAVGTLTIPVLVLGVLLALCAYNGVSLLGGKDGGLLLARGTATTFLTTLALALNLNSGRFDFSLGSMATLSAVVGATVALQTGGSFLVMATTTIVTGVLLGTFSGLLYVLLGISPMVCSLGVTLLYEGISFSITGGANVTFLLETSLTTFARSTTNMVAVIVVVLLLVHVLFDCSRFGYDYRALLTGQSAAVAAGTRERLNAVGTYAVSGALMGVVGLITASQMGYIEAGRLNFGTIGIMFTAFLPMFIGGYVGRIANDKIGYLVGALCTTLVGLSFAALRLTSTTQAITNALLLVGFLIFLSNEARIRHALRRVVRPGPPPTPPTAPRADAPAVTGASA